jgi:hypothetical protein
MKCEGCGQGMRQINSPWARIKLFWCVRCHRFIERRDSN